jgi:hypothetical protein
MNELTIIESMDLQQVGNTMNNIAKFQAILQSQLKKGHDYDVIPGTQKPTLLKPGAEKTLMLLGLTSEYQVIEKVEDYQKGIFAYTVKCTLARNGNKITEGLGSCNSKEDKYRWRWAKENELPAGLDKDALKSKTNVYGTTRYRVENDDICSQANTILKMAKKRAQIDATLTVAALSEVFTQDLEDMRDFIQAEKLDNMKDDEVGNIKINFGKYKGQTLQEVAKSDIGYVRWIAEKGKDEVMRKAADMILNGKQEPPKDVYVNKGDKPQDDGPLPWDEGGQASE